MDRTVAELVTSAAVITASPDFDQVLRMTEEEFAANPPPGFSYDKSAKRWHGRRAKRGHTILGPGFFKGDRKKRTYILYHEVGHDLMVNFNRDWAEVLEPHRLNPERPLGANSKYNNPYGFDQNPEEMVADIYAALFIGGEKWFDGEKYKALFRQARKLAKKYGLPLP